MRIIALWFLRIKSYNYQIFLYFETFPKRIYTAQRMNFVLNRSLEFHIFPSIMAAVAN